ISHMFHNRDTDAHKTIYTQPPPAQDQPHPKTSQSSDTDEDMNYINSFLKKNPNFLVVFRILVEIFDSPASPSVSSQPTTETKRSYPVASRTTTQQKLRRLVKKLVLN
ncbi:hypothetical protein L0F63_004637, partial [Massospora cicadina]